MGRDAGPGLESGFRPVPGGAHRAGFRAAGHRGLHAAGCRGRPFSPGETGADVADRRDEEPGQVEDGVEQVLRVGAAQDLAALGEGDLDHRDRRKWPPGRVATLARVAQGQYNRIFNSTLPVPVPG